jgi:DNA end-binding protein Ku
VTLRFAQEVRSEAEYFSDIPEMKLPPEMMRLAQHIIRTKSADFDPSMLEDHYRNALVRILRKKQAKRRAHPALVTPLHENVVNLMEALQRSIAAERLAKPAPRRGAAKSAPAKRVRRHRGGG